MSIRMIEYDFIIAVDNKEKGENEYVLRMPRSCVLYLRHTDNTPDYLNIKLILSGQGSEPETTVAYKTPIVKVQNYVKDEIFQKRLLAFLPFYIMRYEKQFSKIESDEIKISQLINEYEDIQNKLEDKLTDMEKSEAYTDIISLITRISDYMLQKKPIIMEGVRSVMGGKILELESERIAREAATEGILNTISVFRDLKFTKENTIDKLTQIYPKITDIRELVEKHWR